MTEDQLVALKEWVEALIDDKIHSAFGRDGLHEAIALGKADMTLAAAFFDHRKGEY